MPKLIPTLIFLTMILTILTLWYAVDLVFFFGTILELDMKQISLGDWGDAFGPINSLFSGLAFLGVATTVYLQRQANETFQSQAGKTEFERVYFQLISLLRELRSELRYSQKSRGKVESKNGGEIYGSAAIKAAFQAVNETLYDRIEDANGIQFQKLADELSQIYRVKVQRFHQAEFGPYFRIIYNILRRIDECNYITHAEKLDYSRLLRSQMTEYESSLLGINALTKESKDLKKYVTKYRMLKYSREGIIQQCLRLKYPEKAFVGRTTDHDLGE